MSKNSNINFVAENAKEPLGDFGRCDSEAYVIKDQVLKLGSDLSDDIYLDSGADCSVVNNIKNPTNIIKVDKKVNTYSKPGNITHQGALILQGVHLSPVYHSTKGKVNLLFVFQPVDHGLNPVLKGGSFLIMQGRRIIEKLNFSGNLFSAKIHSQSVFSLSNSEKSKYWYTVLGHTSNKYTKRVLDSRKITESFSPSSELKVFLHAKTKRLPHSQNLPSTHSPFVKTHMDIIEISLPSCQGYQYVLAMVDDFSCFNCIFMMTEKGKAEVFIN
ncbi:hypothetical protein O181_070905 [Austropuccinia psidii MF-1]|uniref:Uncharacterized protein n=1 Tax=Austropuccinia psidii MF-1 TaxID=1389203 RepID=A0A9Q3I9J0_9BASI|nr:hypothetical protein [Austropuccinia psidii MF-1]